MLIGGRARFPLGELVGLVVVMGFIAGKARFPLGK